MSKFFHLTKRPTKKIQRRSKIFSGLRINIKTVNIVIAVLIVVTGVSYLVQVNGLATKGYQIKELEQKIVELKQGKADLELETLSLQSMGAVKDKVDTLGLVAASEENDYLAPAPVALAR